MPSTVNGIGTTYFLKQNKTFRDGVCEHCQAHVRLQSYETWYCICVVFIPVIPLGKKQILDHCPSCTRHRSISMKEWERIRSEAIAETSEELADAKDDFNAAIKMHATLVAVQKATEAEQLAKIMLDKFGHEPQVHLYVGSYYERTGKTAQANASFLKAHELEPENLSFKRAAAMVHIEEQRVDQGRELLQAFAPGTPQFEPVLFYLLASGYQKQGRHAEALEVFKQLYAAAPGVAQDASFRNAVKISEKAVGVEKPLIPYDPWYKKSAVRWTAAAAIVLGVLLGWNYYIATHRTLHVVNGLKQPIAVSVDGGPAIQVGAFSRIPVTIGEGAHRAEVTDPPATFTPIQFNIAAGWWERYFRSPVYVADPSRSAGLSFEQTVYAQNPVGEHDPDQKFLPHIGEPFLSVPHADYHFEEFPAQVQVKGNGRVIKTRVGMLREAPVSLANFARAMGKSNGDLLDFVEAHVTVDPADDQLVQTYAALGLTSAPARVLAFFEKHLSDRPVRVLLHRRYQDLLRMQDGAEKVSELEARLIEKYDTWLKAEPENASLLALRGRLGNRISTVVPFLDRALAIDPKHPYALMSRAFSVLNSGDAKGSVDYYRRAAEAKPNDPEFMTALFDSRFAAGDFVALEQELRKVLEQKPQDMESILNLTRVLAAMNNPAGAEQEYQAAQGRLVQLRSHPEMAKIMAERLDLPYLYVKGDWAGMEQKLTQLNDPVANAETSFVAGVEAGKLPAVPGSTYAFRKPYWMLCRYLAATRQGNAEQAAASKQEALAVLKAGDSGDIAVAKLLENPAEVKFEDARDLTFSSSLKAVFLVVLANDAPQIREQCLDLAEKLNTEMEFPYHLLKSTIAGLRMK